MRGQRVNLRSQNAVNDQRLAWKSGDASSAENVFPVVAEVAVCDSRLRTQLVLNCGGTPKFVLDADVPERLTLPQILVLNLRSRRGRCGQQDEATDVTLFPIGDVVEKLFGGSADQRGSQSVGLNALALAET